jgi:uncharacterized protein YaaR (DUF327 family)
MAKAKLKTKKTDANVNSFLESLDNEQQKHDSEEIVKMMKKATKAEPKMWGKSIIGFGEVHLKYDSGRELDWFKIGFSPRKSNLSLYVLNYAEDEISDKLDKLGKHKTGKNCLYIKNLEDIDKKTLQEIFNWAADRAGK